MFWNNEPHSFISGNTLIGIRHLCWILTGPSFAVLSRSTLQKIRRTDATGRDAQKTTLPQGGEKCYFLILILIFSLINVMFLVNEHNLLFTVLITLELWVKKSSPYKEMSIKFKEKNQLEKLLKICFRMK
jgi:hypothetical protein